MTKTKHQGISEEHIDYKDKYLRSLAEYQNLLKRTEKEKQDTVVYACEKFAEKLIPVLDHLNRAKAHNKDEGVELVYKELVRVLHEIGVSEIEVHDNDVFDPVRMECIEAQEGGEYIEVLQTGYMFKDKIIRPARVKVINKVK